MELTQDRDGWRALVRTVKKLSGSIKMRGISLLAAKTGQLLKDTAPWSK
jgi:hypothetical protein